MAQQDRTAVSEKMPADQPLSLWTTSVVQCFSLGLMICKTKFVNL